jgi:hypothetical protein
MSFERPDGELHPGVSMLDLEFERDMEAGDAYDRRLRNACFRFRSKGLALKTWRVKGACTSKRRAVSSNRSLRRMWLQIVR